MRLDDLDYEAFTAHSDAVSALGRAAGRLRDEGQEVRLSLVPGEAPGLRLVYVTPPAPTRAVEALTMRIDASEIDRVLDRMEEIGAAEEAVPSSRRPNPYLGTGLDVAGGPEHQAVPPAIDPPDVALEAPGPEAAAWAAAAAATDDPEDDDGSLTPDDPEDDDGEVIAEIIIPVGTVTGADLRAEMAARQAAEDVPAADGVPDDAPVVETAEEPAQPEPSPEPTAAKGPRRTPKGGDYDEIRRLMDEGLTSPQIADRLWLYPSQVLVVVQREIKARQEALKAQLAGPADAAEPRTEAADRAGAPMVAAIPAAKGWGEAEDLLLFEMAQDGAEPALYEDQFGFTVDACRARIKAVRAAFAPKATTAAIVDALRARAAAAERAA